MKNWLAVLLVTLSANAALADPLTCNLADYKAAPGLSAAVAENTLVLTWDGAGDQQVRLQFTIEKGTPTIRDLAVRRKGGQWATLVSNVTPDYRVAIGLRRATDQQINPLRDLKVEITPEVIDEIKWEAFWDAPLNVPGGDDAHGGATPPIHGVANQPGLPRKPEEVRRATASFQTTACSVKSNGGRLEVMFPGVELGVFAGRLEYTVYKGVNLIKQSVVAKTEEKSVAYKYEAGLKNVRIQPSSRVVWRSVANEWVDNRLGGAKNENVVPLKAANRLVVVEGQGGSIAAFPPPHRFFTAREIEYNLGYNFYRKDSETTFAFGVRHAEGEEDPSFVGRGPEDVRQNFALHSARPGTWQQMPVFFLVSPDAALPTAESTLAFTRNDRYKALPGYKVMASHFHTSMVSRMRDLGGIDVNLPDFDVMKAAGVNIFAPIDGGRGFGGGRGRGAGPARGGAAGATPARGGMAAVAPDDVRFRAQAEYYEAARRHSDKDFLVMPAEEGMGGNLGGHNDFLVSKPTYWTLGRASGQPFVEQHPTYGKVYHVGSQADMMELAKLEKMLVFMPHPRSKGSTGWPDAMKDTAHFQHPNYRGIGMRWGMGIDGSETRLCEYRCQVLLDDMNNWVADLPTPPKYIHAISETYRKGPGDDIYANNPVNYVKLDSVPTVDDMSPIIDAMMRGDYFWTSGEVLIPSYRVEGNGSERTIAASVEWTFPLDFVEVVWGDGKKTDRQIIPAADLPAFSKKEFRIPFSATGKKWVRFAVWDVAGNGALVQPIKLTSATVTTTSSR
jgi:hypothetical protein